MPNDDVLTIGFRGHQVTAELVNGELRLSIPAEAMRAATADGPEKAIDIALIAKLIQLVFQLLGLVGGGA